MKVFFLVLVFMACSCGARMDAETMEEVRKANCPGFMETLDNGKPLTAEDELLKLFCEGGE